VATVPVAAVQYQCPVVSKWSGVELRNLLYTLHFTELHCTDFVTCIRSSPRLLVFALASLVSLGGKLLFSPFIDL
jgi:hypothetical protein